MMMGLALGGATNMGNIFIAVTAVVSTIATILLVLNLKGGEKTIQRSVERLYDAQDR
jgi:hypothetical protein